MCYSEIYTLVYLTCICTLHVYYYYKECRLIIQKSRRWLPVDRHHQKTGWQTHKYYSLNCTHKDSNRYSNIYEWPISIKRCSTLWVVKKTHTKTTTRYHFTPAQMVKTGKTEPNEYWWGSRKTGSLTHCWLEYKMSQPLGK